MIAQPVVKPIRLQASRVAGFRLQDHSRAINGLPARKVTRPGVMGNPFVVGKTMPHPITGELVHVVDAEVAVYLYMLWIEVELTRNIELFVALILARGHNLACTCKPGAPCHADELLWRANF